MRIGQHRPDQLRPRIPGAEDQHLLGLLRAGVVVTHHPNRDPAGEAADQGEHARDQRHRQRDDTRDGQHREAQRHHESRAEKHRSQRHGLIEAANAVPTLVNAQRSRNQHMH